MFCKVVRVCTHGCRLTKRVLDFCVTRCVTRMGKNVQIPDYA